jgi:hypothetical protein
MCLNHSAAHAVMVTGWMHLMMHDRHMVMLDQNRMLMQSRSKP